jgi:hypothetical protein
MFPVILCYLQMTGIMITYDTHPLSCSFLHKCESEESQNITAMPASDSKTKSCSLCDPLGKDREPWALSDGPSCLLNFPI